MESYDTPLLILRLFHLKLKAVLEEILSGKIFGTIIGYVYTIVSEMGIATCTHAFYKKT